MSMVRAPDHLAKAIIALLRPALTDAGFLHYRPKHFIRIRNELVDSIGFQLSQYGDKGFYVHRYIGLLSNPLFDPHTYRVGKRIDRSPYDEVPWSTASATAANAAVVSARQMIVDESLPWFASVGNLSDFVLEYIANPNNQITTLDLAAALVRTGHTDRPWWICNDISVRSDEDCSTADAAKSLLEALNSETQVAFLDRARRENIARHKLNIAYASRDGYFGTGPHSFPAQPPDDPCRHD